MQNLTHLIYNFFVLEHYDAAGKYIFNSLNISHTLYVFIFFILLAFVFIGFLIWNIFLNKKLKRFLLGADAKSLEEILKQNIKDVANLKEENKIIESHIVHHNKKLESVVRDVTTVRFKASENAESNQSFATAFLNDTGDGVIISTLCIRNHTSIFAKPIHKYKSEYELNDEEKEVLEKVKEEHKGLR